MQVIAQVKPVGRETHADGTEYVSFRVLEGTFPGGPWNDGAEYYVTIGDNDVE